MITFGQIKGRNHLNHFRAPKSKFTPWSKKASFLNMIFVYEWPFCIEPKVGGIWDHFRTSRSKCKPWSTKVSILNHLVSWKNISQLIYVYAGLIGIHGSQLPDDPPTIDFCKCGLHGDSRVAASEWSSHNWFLHKQAPLRLPGRSFQMTLLNFKSKVESYGAISGSGNPIWTLVGKGDGPLQHPCVRMITFGQIKGRSHLNHFQAPKSKFTPWSKKVSFLNMIFVYEWISANAGSMATPGSQLPDDPPTIDFCIYKLHCDSRVAACEWSPHSWLLHIRISAPLLNPCEAICLENQSILYIWYTFEGIIIRFESNPLGRRNLYS